jgi:hypothetical protein
LSWREIFAILFAVEDSDREIVLRVLALAEKMAESLSPVEVIRALNGGGVAGEGAVRVPERLNPWSGDEDRAAGVERPEDPWGDPRATFEEAVAAGRQGGWTPPPFTPPPTIPIPPTIPLIEQTGGDEFHGEATGTE